MKFPAMFWLTILVIALACRATSGAGQVVDIHVESQGCNETARVPGPCGRAYISVNGKDRSPHKRGGNVVILDGATGEFLDAMGFDTFNDSTAGGRLREYLNGITGNKIVVVAIQEDGSRFVSQTIEALERLGATYINPDVRGSFAFVGYAEDPKPSWISQQQRNSSQGPSVVSVQIPLSPNVMNPLDMMNEILNCEYGNPACECSAKATVCTFNLEIDEIRTFTSYPKLFVDEPTGVAMRGTQGVIYYFDDNGNPVPLQPNRTCSTMTNTNCTNPQFVDGSTFRMAIAVNGQIPGPTLIVHEGQTVVIHVHNNLTTEGISIHWHGMHQKGTPYMDGVGQVTQCPIGPQSSFSYRYLASPSGTFWYHSHTGTQRTEGLYGALIVKETPKRIADIQAELQRRGACCKFEDLPDQHTLTLLDWQEEPSLDLFTKILGKVGFYPGKLPGKVPTPKDATYSRTDSFEGAGVGPIPYFSGLINGKGRHADVPYIKTRLSIFTVEAGKTYRFRLVGAQGLYAYRFSIDGHKLTVVGTDGYWLRPVRNVDYIIIHTGERYDFLLTATNRFELTDYWMRAETLEIDRSRSRPPYRSLGHVAEAILHYKQPGDSDDPDINVPSFKYDDIKYRSPSKRCTPFDKCKAVNCPFRDFHPSYHIVCVNVQDLRLLEPTPPNELPNANPKNAAKCPNCRHFINFSFEGDSQTSSVNGRNFIFPSFPPQTQTRQFKEKDTKCSLAADCNPFTTACTCVNVIDIPQDETVQMVFSAIGVRDNAHPIHLHGHTFHVVHVGYPDYNRTNGFITNHTTDIYCEDKFCTKVGCDKRRCTKPGPVPDAMNFKINRHTVRKDTVMVPAGGYVVINFISDNPGFWFLHCHIEIHQLQGMALIVNEISEEWPQPPPGMNKCGDFELWSMSDEQSTRKITVRNVY